MKKIIITLLTLFCAILLISCAETKSENDTVILGGIKYFFNESEEGSYYSARAADKTITTAQVAAYINGYPVKYLPDHAFYDCKLLESISLPNSIDTMGDYAFWGCSSLKTIYLPDSIEEIGFQCFQYCRSLESIDMPDELKEISWEAFEYCSKLKEVELPEGVTGIGEKAFLECTSLEHIKMPETMSYIGKMAFWECNNLKEIRIPQGITSIQKGTFHDCINLEKIYIPKSVEWIGTLSFDYDGESCKSLEIYYEGTEADWENIVHEKTGDAVHDMYDRTRFRLQINNLTFESARP